MVNRTIWIAWCLSTIEIEEISFSIHWLCRMSFLFSYFCVCVFLFGNRFSLSHCVWVCKCEWARFLAKILTQNWLKKSFTSASNCATASAVIAAAVAADISLPLTIWSHTISLVLLMLLLTSFAASSSFSFLVSSFHFVCRNNFFPLCSVRCFEQIPSFYRINLMLYE